MKFFTPTKVKSSRIDIFTSVKDNASESTSGTSPKIMKPMTGIAARKK